MLSTLKLGSVEEVGKAYPLDPDPATSFAGGFVVKVLNKVDGAVNHPENAGEWFVAFGSTCPHMGCRVNSVSWSSSSLVTRPCPCHGSTFDLTKGGLVVLGPATQNLPQLELRISVDETELKVIGWRRKMEVDPGNENWPCDPDSLNSTGIT